MKQTINNTNNKKLNAIIIQTINEENLAIKFDYKVIEKSL